MTEGDEFNQTVPDIPVITITLAELKELCKARSVVIRVGSRAAKIAVVGD